MKNRLFIGRRIKLAKNNNMMMMLLLPRLSCPIGCEKKREYESKPSLSSPSNTSQVVPLQRLRNRLLILGIILYTRRERWISLTEQESIPAPPSMSQCWSIDVVFVLCMRVVMDLVTFSHAANHGRSVGVSVHRTNESADVRPPITAAL